MHLSLENNIFELQPKSLAILPVSFDDKIWLQVMNAAFEGHDLTTNQYSQALGRAQTKGIDMQHFQGCINNQPVATLTLTFLNNCVKVDNVATHPNHQRQGYALQMLQFGLELAQANGAKHCFLDASSDGLNLYKRCGFAEIFTYHIYGINR